jgi:hypothetical protein
MSNAMHLEGSAPGDLKTVYVGEFVGFKYDGVGCMFLPNTSMAVHESLITIPDGFPVFEGQFSAGRPVRGIIKSPIRGGSVASVEFDALGRYIPSSIRYL